MKGLATAGLTLSIAGLVFGFVGMFLWYLALPALPLAIVGLVLSASAGKKLKLAELPAGMATAGLVVGIIATVISGITFFTCGVCGLCLLIEGDQIIDGLNDIANNGNRYGW